MIINFSHIDLDGAVAALMVRKSFPDQEVKTIFINYNNISNAIRKNITELQAADLIIFTDICFSKQEDYDYLKGLNESIMVIDHHDTALQWHNGETLIIDTETCGSFNVFKYLEPKVTSEDIYLLNVTNAWDMYIEDHVNFDEAKDYALYCSFIGVEETFNQLCKSSVIDTRLLKGVKAKCERYLKTLPYSLTKATAGKYEIGLLITSEFIGEYADAILKECDIAVLVNPHSRNISFRTKLEDIHLGDFCKVNFNGGGHSKASGITFEKQLDFIELIPKILEKFGEL